MFRHVWISLTERPLVKHIAGVLYPESEEERFAWVLDETSRLWGKPDLVGEPVPYSYSFVTFLNFKKLILDSLSFFNTTYINTNHPF